MNNSLTTQFEAQEKLYRAIYPPDKMAMYWKENGELSSAAFKDRCGLSVERGYGRLDCDVAAEMHNYFDGLIYSITVGDCENECAYVVYLPSLRSKYHTEIHGSKERVVLSASQCKALSRKAKYVPY